MPLFSIVTITYNAASTIVRTAQSVASQTFKDYEHIIVDGASSDDTLDLLEKCPTAIPRKIVSEPDEGLYDAMNKGIGLASGDYLIFLNAGDKFHSSETLAEIAATIERNNRPGIVYGQTYLVDDKGKYIAPRHLSAPEKLTLADFSRGMLVCHQAFVPLRRIAPLYDVKYKFSADYDWCVKCLMHSRKNVYTGTVLIDYLAEGLTTANRRKSLIERFRIMCRYYGWMPTVIRHIGFAFRFTKNRRQLNAASKKQSL